MTSLALLFAVAAALFVYPLWPEFSYQLNQLQPTSASQAVAPLINQQAIAPVAHQAALVAMPNRLSIPAIGVDTPIIEGPSLAVLNKAEGVWHQSGSASQGNLVLAGHRFKYLPPNTSTLYSLNRVHAGEAIEVDWLGKKDIYDVTKVEVVNANDVSILNRSARPELTVYSCDDIAMTKRVVVVASLVSSS
jgi:LPXTG-site transpeptidase (sortase) family protein